MIMQSNSILLSLLLDLVLLIRVQSLSIRDNIDCVYANSTCSSCDNLCNSGKFYPLFPSRCHPSYRYLTHSLEESYPGRMSPSVRFHGNSSFSVPEDLLAGLTGLRGYTIALYFKEQSLNGTLFELNNELAIRLTSEQQLEYFLPQLADKNRDIIAPYDASLSSQWKSVFFTFQDSGGVLTLSTHFGIESANDAVDHNPTVEYAGTISSIIIGEDFNGFLQDIRVYIPKLQTMDSRVVIPTEASFLPQCLCQNRYSISQSETQCTMMDQSASVMRYNMNAHTAEFSADTSTTTVWQSNDNDSLVSLVVGLSPSVSLSKIFITFSSSLPTKTTLQYYSEHASEWRDLQYFAKNCEQSFQMGNDEQLRGSFDVNCLHYTSNTTLTFLLAGTGMNARFPPSEDATPFEVYYNASRVQLIMSGFMNSATNYAIRDIEICPNYCLDFENNCAATTEGSTDIVCSSLMFDQGSGERYGMLVPESTSAIDVQETSPTAQEVSTLANLTSSTTTLTSTAIASSTESSTMTKSSTAQDPSNSSINDNQSLGTAILGGIAALFATIIIIIILVYIVKKYRKKRIYKPQVRDFIHEEERIELHPVNGDQQHHVYDYPVAADIPPLLPPRPLSMSFTESSAQFAPHGESAAEASIVQQNEQPNIERRHPIIANIPWTNNVNRVHSEVDLSTCSSSGYQIVDNVDNTTVGISMQKNLAYSGLVLANTQVQESSTSPCIDLTSEQNISSSESSSEDYHVFIDSVRQQTQHCDSVGLLFRTGALNHGAALTSVVRSDAIHQDTPKLLDSEQLAEDQSTCAIEAQHGDCDKEQSLLSHQNTDSEGKLPVQLSLQSETSSCTGNENQQLTSYERIWGYERVYHCDIPLESLLHKGCSKPEDTSS